MGAQERTEEVLRSIHTLFSKAPAYDTTGQQVIVDKAVLMNLLKELNSCMYEMQEEYELTEQSRDKATRKTKKEGEDMIFEAQKRADDVYAGAIMYTDNALHDIQDIIQETNDQVYVLMERMRDRLRRAKEDVRSNQTELKSQLADMVDTQKYLRLIEEENERKAKEKARKEAKRQQIKNSPRKETASEIDPLDEEEEPKVTAVMPEIRINTAFLEEHGMSVGGEEEEAEAPAPVKTDNDDIDLKNIEANLNHVIDADGKEEDDGLTAEERLKNIRPEDLDGEYFSWKEEEKDEDNEDRAESIMAGVLEDMKDQFKEIFKK